MTDNKPNQGEFIANYAIHSLNQILIVNDNIN